MTRQPKSKQKKMKLLDISCIFKFLIVTSLDLERFGENFYLKAKTW